MGIYHRFYCMKIDTFVFLAHYGEMARWCRAFIQLCQICCICCSVTWKKILLQNLPRQKIPRDKLTWKKQKIMQFVSNAWHRSKSNIPIWYHFAKGIVAKKLTNPIIYSKPTGQQRRNNFPFTSCVENIAFLFLRFLQHYKLNFEKIFNRWLIKF